MAETLKKEGSNPITKGSNPVTKGSDPIKKGSNSVKGSQAISRDNFLVSVSPHIKDDVTVEKIMKTVIISLLPAFFTGVYFFGPRAVYVTAFCIITALLSELVFNKFVKAPLTIKDGSALLTGLLIGLNMPATVPFYIPLVSTFFGIVITKQLFGGLGYNVFNPALMARAFALITWPRAMTNWIEPTARFIGVDAHTTATPLGILKEDGLDKLMTVFGSASNMYQELFFGHRAGSLGETSILALLIGAAILLYKRYITWHIPLSFLGTAALLAWIFGGNSGFFTGDPLLHLLSGGMVLGAFFMATDYVTAPSLKAGQILFGICCGAITMLIRLKGGFPEGVMFAILIMNCFAPIIDRNFNTKVFGAKKSPKGIIA